MLSTFEAAWYLAVQHCAVAPEVQFFSVQERVVGVGPGHRMKSSKNVDLEVHFQNGSVCPTLSFVVSKSLH